MKNFKAYKIKNIIFSVGKVKLVCSECDGTALTIYVDHEFMEQWAPRRGDMLVMAPGKDPISVPETAYEVFCDKSSDLDNPYIDTEMRDGEDIVNTLMDMLERPGVEAQINCAGPDFSAVVEITMAKNAGGWTLRVSYPYTQDELKFMNDNEWQWCVKQLRDGLELLADNPVIAAPVSIKTAMVPGGRPVIE